MLTNSKFTLLVSAGFVVASRFLEEIPTNVVRVWDATETVFATVDSPASLEKFVTAATLSVSGRPVDDTASRGTLSPASVVSSSMMVASTSSSTPFVGGADGSYMSVVSHWRSAYGLSDLSLDSTLEKNAQKTADESVGGLKHQLNPGSAAQVLAPGEANNFEHVYLGGWLCELPDVPALAGVCETASEGWSYEGQTGHAEILSSIDYSTIGCAFSDGTGVWACDLA